MSQQDFDFSREEPASATWKKYTFHTLLAVVTFFTTAIAGVQWLNKDPIELSNFNYGVPYAMLIMLMLGAHEFGHYTAARLHGVRATLPYFIPFPSFFGLNPFGTMGAVIKLRSEITSRRVLFDIGAAGPLAGFVVSSALLIYGFRHLPPIEFLYTIHPEYATLDRIPEAGPNALTFGSNLIYSLLSKLLAPEGAFVPPMTEVYHYPFLCVGWFGLFVTAMNLIPVGQLDGGHISFAMFGVRSRLIGQIALVLLVALGLAGFLPLLGIPFHQGWSGWLFWAFILIFFIRGRRPQRPPVEDDAPLDPTRQLLGWFCVFIFVGSFSLTPFTIQLP